MFVPLVLAALAAPGQEPVAAPAQATLAAPVQEFPASTISREFRPGEHAVWVFEQEGTRLGVHASRYLGLDGIAGKPAHHFQGWLRLQLTKAAAEIRSTADLWTDDLGHPVRFTTHGYVGELYSRADLDFRDAEVLVRVVQGTAVRERPRPVEPGALLLCNNYISHLEIVLQLAKPGAEVTVPMFSGNTIKGFEYKLTPQGTFEHEADGAKQTGYVYQDSLGGEMRVLDQHVIEVAIPQAKIVIRRSDEPFTPFTIVAPELTAAAANFAVEKVAIACNGGTIAGEVTKPKEAKGRLPAVFFVSGSGLQDRYGMSSGIDTGAHELLDRLTTDGFLVLRVDDRGAGESSPAPPDMSYTDLVSDARACVEFLKQRDDVDPARIAVIGHSEGGQTAPILATEPLGIAAIVLMAAPGRSMLAIMTDQNRMALEAEGLEGKELEAKLALVVDLLKRLCSDATVDPEELPLDQRAILSNRAWLRTHALQDPLATIRKVRCPVLILQGAKDFQVSLDRDARALEAALKESGNADHELRAFDNLDHLFKEVPGEKSELVDYFKSRPVSPAFLDAISGWLCQRLKVEPH